MLGNKQNTGKREDGFTLIELLVVIAIISLLVSILLPSLTAAKDLARSALCLSQYHQIGVAMQMYMGDHEGLIPQPILMYHPSGTGERDWANTLLTFQYVDTDKLFLDPGCNGETDPRWGQLIGGYGMNAYWIDGSYYDNKQFPPVNVKAPSEEVVCCDNRGIWAVGPLLDIYDAGLHPDFWGGGDAVNARRPRMATRHMGSPNTLFLDWHAEHISVDLATEWSEYWIDHNFWPPPYCWAPSLN